MQNALTWREPSRLTSHCQPAARSLKRARLRDQPLRDAAQAHELRMIGRREQVLRGGLPLELHVLLGRRLLDLLGRREARSRGSCARRRCPPARPARRAPPPARRPPNSIVATTKPPARRVAARRARRPPGRRPGAVVGAVDGRSFMGRTVPAGGADRPRDASLPQGSHAAADRAHRCATLAAMIKTEAARRPPSAYAQVFASRRIAAMLVLGFSSGLPLAADGRGRCRPG